MQRAPTTIPEPDPRERALARTLGLPALLARVLLARGLDDPDRARAHLRPQLSTLKDPFLFRDMDRAVQRIRSAVRAGEPILIHGDYDVDGISGTVLPTVIWIPQSATSFDGSLLKGARQVDYRVLLRRRRR